MNYEDYVLCSYCENFFNYQDHRDTLVVIRKSWGWKWICASCNVEREKNIEIRKAYAIYLKALFLEMCERYNWICPCCGEGGKKLTIDHIVPKSKGGKNIIENIQPLCRPCNARKGNQGRRRYPRRKVPV